MTEPDDPPSKQHVDIRLRPGRTFELVCNVTGYLPGGLDDWPSQIQDQVYAAMERLIQRVDRKMELHVLASRCGRDIPGEPYYVHVIVCEVVPTVVISNEAPN